MRSDMRPFAGVRDGAVIRTMKSEMLGFSSIQWNIIRMRRRRGDLDDRVIRGFKSSGLPMSMDVPNLYGRKVLEVDLLE